MKNHKRKDPVRGIDMDKYKEIEFDTSSVPQWEMDVYQIVADLAVFRVKQRITQEELAKRVNTTQSVVARFERAGRIPTIEFIYKIAEGLGVELEPLKIDLVNQLTENEEDKQNFPDAVFAKWEQNVYQIVADLAVYRVKQRITQAELAKKINTSQSVITRFERLGRIPTLKFIYRIAEGLGVKLLPFKISTEDKIIQRSWGSDIIETIGSFNETWDSACDPSEYSAVFSEDIKQIVLDDYEYSYNIETIKGSASKVTTVQEAARNSSCWDKTTDDESVVSFDANACEVTNEKLLAA